MKNLILDFTSFIKSLTFVDILFIISLIGLVVLLVVLIYIIKMNNDEEIELIEENEVKETNNDNVEELDLVSLSKEIEEKPNRPITLNDYEREQEEKAIISYDELIKTKDIPLEEINYKNEEEKDGLTIRTVNQEEITKPIELPRIKLKESKINQDNDEKDALINYVKEEEFLDALKKLESILN